MAGGIKKYVYGLVNGRFKYLGRANPSVVPRAKKTRRRKRSR